MHFKVVTVTYLWCLTILGAYAEEILYKTPKGCSLHTVDFFQCGPHETCLSVHDSGTCQCSRGFDMLDSGVCQPVPKEPVPSHSSNTSDSSDSGGFGFKLVLWLLIPVLLAGAVGGVLYTGRQKAWLSRLYRLRVRSYNNVLSSRPV